MLKNFESMAEIVRKNPIKCRLAVAAAQDGAVIDAVLNAEKEGIVEPLLVGDENTIKQLLVDRDADPSAYVIVDAAEGTEGQAAVDLVNSGKADALMKGLTDTKLFLGPIVKKENNLRTSGLMSHVVFNKLPNYDKLIMSTDGGMVMYPTLEEKKLIIENACVALKAMGYENPKFAVLCAVEKVNPKMPETVDAAALQEMNEKGEIAGCTVVGPISYDCAMSPTIAAHKGFKCPHSGDFDCLIMPNIQAGNILGKCFTVTCGAPMAGIIVGAKVPAVMTSRGSDASEKFNSIVMAALVSMGMKK